MKNFVLLLALILLGTTSIAQKENGTVYSEHESIEKTKALWSAFAIGDKDEFTAFFADSVYLFINGKLNNVTKENIGNSVKWWTEEIENLKIEDSKPAYPDAIEYKTGGTWVQDWLKFTGIHVKTGINLDLHYHNLYSFNKEGKINSIFFYFNDDIFEEINNSLTTKENGKVYINHPYIVSVRKAINAIYNAKDVEAWAEFFTPNARFGASSMKVGKTIDLETKKNQLKKMLLSGNEKKIKQIGYPDCIYYVKGDYYVVYSWWTVIHIEGDKKVEIPFMLSHNFNKDGKIVRAYSYFSTNHFE